MAARGTCHEWAEAGLHHNWRLVVRHCTTLLATTGRRPCVQLENQGARLRHSAMQVRCDVGRALVLHDRMAAASAPARDCFEAANILPRNTRGRSFSAPSHNTRGVRIGFGAMNL